MYVYTYIYIYACICICIYTYRYVGKPSKTVPSSRTSDARLRVSSHLGRAFGRSQNVLFELVFCSVSARIRRLREFPQYCLASLYWKTKE